MGSGVAGVAAAVGAQRAGAKTLLLEVTGCLGGAATMKNVLTYCGLYTCGEATPRQAVLGVAEQMLMHLKALGVPADPVKFRGVFVLLDSEAVKLALDRVCAEAGVEVLLHAHVTGAHRSHDDRLTSVTVSDHLGQRTLHAKAFVDASGDCDLAFFGGASVRYGNHGHINTGTLGVRLGGISPQASLQAAAWGQAVKQAKAKGIGPLDAESGFVARLPITGDVLHLFVNAEYNTLLASSISDAERLGRQQAWAYREAFAAMPGCEQAYIVSTGPVFGTRESRHINSVRQLTQQDVAEGRASAPGVGLGAWPMEYHTNAHDPSTWLSIKDGLTYDIPLECLMSVNTPNLFAAGRTADGDQLAGASLRVMGTAFATGHAAGAAAALLAQTSHTVPEAVRHELQQQGALLRLPPPISTRCPGCPCCQWRRWPLNKGGVS